MTTEKFHYTLPDEAKTQITLPRFKQIPLGVMRRLRKESDSEQLFGLFEALVDKGLMSEADLGALDDIGLGDIEKLMDAWQADGGITAGE
ncbi:hypothetical protein MYK68_13980 [Gordonia sp. PP30]|uniref:hypothetical protein n=1 Tax=Gordonia sp. PP30 TaxID=2935861 RepID=UPI001FFEF4A8|nr:hypothetical protein [Gordonia sp. PP30]UQE73839.1 hypothetical protein MYK68_13980 [Gordonia sp. PP30]